MKNLKRLSALLIAVCFIVLMIPAAASAETRAAAQTEPTRRLRSSVKLDTDPEGGYEGDYVVIYNPSETTTSGVTTGNLRNLIETTVSANVLAKADIPEGKQIIDIDPQMEELAREMGVYDAERHPNATREELVVGSTKSIRIYNENPDGQDGNITFKVLAIGEHCIVWTPTTNGNGKYHPLDEIDTSFGDQAANEFDEKFELMYASFGDFYDPTGEGKVNLMFYNIEDGWTEDSDDGYIAGYFWAADLYYDEFVSQGYGYMNNMAMIHIDTYPAIDYPGEGVDLLRGFPTLVHEFQHLINFSNCYMHSWLNEALSAAAEELCYPGSEALLRTYSWVNSATVSNEFKYNSSFKLHKGGSLAYWNNDDSDILVRYGEVLLFSQYLYTQYGSEIFREIITNCPDEEGTVADSFTALKAATGETMETIWRVFFTSMVANCRNFDCGFELSEGYDPNGIGCYGWPDPYQLLAPVIYTSTSAASIQGGGFITVKPKNGVYNPPRNASSTLKYVGIKMNPDYYTVSFDANGGEGTMRVQGFLMDDVKALRTNAFTRKGYVFVGWNTDPDGLGHTIADETVVGHLTTTSGDNITYYAMWRADDAPYYVSYRTEIRNRPEEDAYRDLRFRMKYVYNGNSFWKIFGNTEGDYEVKDLCLRVTYTTGSEHTSGWVSTVKRIFSNNEYFEVSLVVTGIPFTSDTANIEFVVDSAINYQDGDVLVRVNGLTVSGTLGDTAD